jgi:hypothetical protein
MRDLRGVSTCVDGDIVGHFIIERVGLLDALTIDA